LAFVFQKTGNFAAAHELANAQKLAPTDFDVNYIAGLYYFSQMDAERASKAYGQLVKYHPTASAYVLRGRFYQLASMPLQAAEDYGKVLAACPHNVWALKSRSKQYHRMHMWDKAIKDDTALMATKSFGKSTYGRRGVAYVELGQKAKAIPDFTEAIKLSFPGTDGSVLSPTLKKWLPDEACEVREWWLRRATLRGEMGQRAEAMKEVMQMLRMYPDDDDAMFEYEKLLLDGGDLNGAITALNSMIKNSPTVPNWYRARAEVFTKLGKTDDAHRDLVTARKLEKTGHL